MLTVVIVGAAFEAYSVTRNGFFGVVFPIQFGSVLFGQINLHEHCGKLVDFFLTCQKSGYDFVIEKRLQPDRFNLAPASAKGEVESEQYGTFARFVIADENVQFVIELKFEILEALKV
jgi:hypothetical protein